MRLLRTDGIGGFYLAEDFPEGKIPRYAILSHRWLAPSEEPTFEDLCDGRGKEKLGYRKLKFCAEQADRSGLQYFWIDTCCINKIDKAELSRSIKSMFRWYQNAIVCYVYLADVPSEPFQKSAWFTRGWTLQELLAPRSVVFYSADGERLGDKGSLEQQIHEITNIPPSALQGTPLQQFTEDERFSWTETRETALEEDKVYSLLGIFDVEIAPMYREGFAQAFQRLREQISKRKNCLRDLRVTNPTDDKRRIENTKGGLLVDSYRWILENDEYLRWQASEQTPLLWIRGDPGKGKTMLLCGIIDKMEEQTPTPGLLSYFFCEATDSRINNATAVLRGLISLLVSQQPSLASHILEKYDSTGRTLFEDSNAWITLSDIIVSILKAQRIRKIYLVIDGLDECITDLGKLLDLIKQTSDISNRVKWIVSSRNCPAIEERIGRSSSKVALSLELNSQSVSDAVRIFIKHKVKQLSKEKRYDVSTGRAVQHYLLANAEDTFLWVALVCEQLSKIQGWDTLAKLVKFPPGLDALYGRMWDQVCASDNVDLYKRVLASITVTYRPLMLEELTAIVELPEDLSDNVAVVRKIVEGCGSFLTVRNGIVYFVHQSAKEFLSEVVSDQVSPDSREEVHQEIVLRCLRTLSVTLKRDIYHLDAPGYPIEDVERPNPDPLARCGYGCVFWIRHLLASISETPLDGGRQQQNRLASVHEFVQNKYMYWLEALSLCRRISEGVFFMAKLQALIEGSLKDSR